MKGTVSRLDMPIQIVAPRTGFATSLHRTGDRTGRDCMSRVDMALVVSELGTPSVRTPRLLAFVGSCVDLCVLSMWVSRCLARLV